MQKQLFYYSNVTHKILTRLVEVNLAYKNVVESVRLGMGYAASVISRYFFNQPRVRMIWSRAYEGTLVCTIFARICDK